MNATGFYLFKKLGYYYIGFTDDTGRRRQKSTRCARKTDAVKVLTDFKQLIAEAQKPKHLLFSSFSRDFLRFAETNYSPKTVLIYAAVFRRFTRIVGDIDLAQITPRHWDTYKTTRLRDHVSLRHKCATPEDTARAIESLRLMSPVSVHEELRTLRAAMNTAVRWQLIGKNPFERLPMPAIPQATPAFLSRTEAEHLIASIGEAWLRDFVIFALNTGMRRGEILSLRWMDIDQKARLAWLRNREDFKTKSGEPRAVALNDAALMALKRRPHYKRYEYVFAASKGRRLTGDYVTKAFKNAVKSSGLSERLHVHSLRHSFASILIGQGTSLFTMSKLLGHSNAKTSEIYSHLLPEYLHREVNKIDIGCRSIGSKTDADTM